MSRIRYLPGARQHSVRLLERAAGEAVARHPDPDVASRWSAMAQESIARWPAPPLPSFSRLALEIQIDEGHRSPLPMLLERWMESYYGDVRDQLLEMHGEMLSLQRQVAEDAVARERAAAPDSSTADTTPRTPDRS